MKKLEFNFEAFKAAMIISIAQTMNIKQLAEALHDIADGMEDLGKRLEDEE